MAERRERRKTRNPEARKSPGVDRDAIVRSTMALFAARGWFEVSLVDIATEAGVSLAELHPVFPSKTAILRGFATAIDRQVLAAAAEADASVRERLFEVFMRRFDALQPHRKALQRLAHDLPRDPAAAVAVACRGGRSLRTMAELAGVGTEGPLGMLRVKALMALQAWLMRTWLADDSKDMARTMKGLDQGLERLEMIARAVPSMRRRAAE